MGKKSKSNEPPQYQSATYNTGGLFGSSTTNKKGVTFKPTAQMSNLHNTAWSGVEDSLNSLNSGDFANDANFQVYQNNLNNQMTRNYNNTVLNNLINNGMVRSSGLQSANNSFANTLNENTANLYDSYANRVQQNLANNQGMLNTLFNMITAINQGSQNQATNLNNYNISRAQAINQANQVNNSLFGQLGTAVGNAAGAYFGNKGKTGAK